MKSTSMTALVDDDDDDDWYSERNTYTQTYRVYSVRKSAPCAQSAREKAADTTGMCVR